MFHDLSEDQTNSCQQTLVEVIKDMESWLCKDKQFDSGKGRTVRNFLRWYIESKKSIYSTLQEWGKK